MSFSTFHARHPVAAKLLGLVLGLAGLYLVLFLAIIAFERPLLYTPSSAPYVPPGTARAHFGMSEISVNNAQNQLHYAWYIPATGHKLTVMYFHDGSETINTINHRLDPVIDAGYGVMLIEYRGYGNVDGEPSEKNIYADTETFFDFLHEVHIPDKDVVLMGHGLGAAVATEMAVRHKVAGLALISPFLSTKSLIHQTLPIFPANPFIQDKYDNLDKIAKIGTSLLICVGTKDTLIPPTDSVALYKAAAATKILRVYDDKGHYDLFAPALYKDVTEWLDVLNDTRLTPQQIEFRRALNTPTDPTLPEEITTKTDEPAAPAPEPQSVPGLIHAPSEAPAPQPALPQPEADKKP